jgi:hypothetical protein
MFSTTRRIVAISVLAGGSAAVLVGWLTGFFGRVVAGASRTWDRFLAWLQAPLDLDHLVAATAAVVVPLVAIFVIIAVLSDD